MRPDLVAVSAQPRLWFLKPWVERNAGEEVLISTPPWQVETSGLRIGNLLDEHTRRRLQLELDQSDDPEGCEWWTSPNGDFRLVTTNGRIALVNLTEKAVVNGTDLVGVDRSTVERLLGPFDSGDELALSFRSGPWEICVGFWDERATWLALSHDDLL